MNPRVVRGRWMAGWLVGWLLGWRSAQCNLWNGKGFQCRVIICQKNDRLHAFISTTAATAPIGSDSMRTFIRENRELSSHQTCHSATSQIKTSTLPF